MRVCEITKLAEHQFNLDDQKFFAKVSGDYNPVHLDEEFARRTMFGKLVVHGIHGAIWALDNYLATLDDFTFSFHSLKMSFLSSIDLSHCVQVYLVEQSGFAFTLEVRNNNQVATIIEGMLDKAQLGRYEPLPKDVGASSCNDLVFEQMEGKTGVVDLFLNYRLLFDRYSSLKKVLSIQISQILTTSKIVGMECPGKHSLFCNLCLQFHKLDLGSLSKKMSYKTIKSNERYSSITLKVEGDGVVGSIRSIIRPVPFQQAEMDIVASLVTEQEFYNQNALIIGGSRGIGEVAAKIIAAGGGKCIITFNRGRDDALKVAKEIQNHGGTCNSVELDILSNPFVINDLVDCKSLTHVYYFATPLITLSNTKKFSFDKFNEFNRFYIRGFCDVIEYLTPLVAAPLKVFYPSTVFLETHDKNSLEYCSSKAAAETICRYLEEHTENRFFVPRLPRVRTDQTNSILPLKLKNPLPVLLNSIRDMENYFREI